MDVPSQFEVRSKRRGPVSRDVSTAETTDDETSWDTERLFVRHTSVLDQRCNVIRLSSLVSALKEVLAVQNHRHCKDSKIR